MATAGARRARTPVEVEVDVDVDGGAPAGAPQRGRLDLSSGDLAELFAEFNAVTSRLQETHETLTARASRLEEELREANQQLRRSRELAALGEMAAGIAHEVRNPLGSIGLYASMLEQDLGAMPEQRRIAMKIGEAVRGLDRIVGDVLTFARENRLRLAEVDAQELLRRAADVCRGAFEASGVALAPPGPGAPPAALRCDTALVHQALVNVVRNAREAVVDAPGRAPGAGRVELSAAPACARGAGGRQTPMIALEVRDDGPGVPDDVLKRMFNPFFTTRAAGTGLGLAIVHRIVDAHGGRVDVRNGDGGGAIVRILLPLNTESSSGDGVAGSQGGGS